LTGHATRSTTRGWRGSCRRFAPAAIAAAIIVGCSVEKHHDLLSFFFDGVPAPAAGRPGAGGGPGAGGRPVPMPIVSAHSAFAERRCEDCHGETGGFGVVISGFSSLDATVCRTCHSQVGEEFPRMHGPVAAQECLWCHWAHESTYPHLLSAGTPELCLGCHGFELRDRPQPAEHEDLGRDCLDCHRGHGGQQQYFLKPPEPGPQDTAETESEPTEFEPRESGETEME
jgi:predicted CXXCH cytochrome family protein